MTRSDQPIEAVGRTAPPWRGRPEAGAPGAYASPPAAPGPPPTEDGFETFADPEQVPAYEDTPGAEGNYPYDPADAADPDPGPDDEPFVGPPHHPYAPPGHQLPGPPPSHQPPRHQPPRHQPPSHQPPSHQPPSHQPPGPPGQQWATAQSPGPPGAADETPGGGLFTMSDNPGRSSPPWRTIGLLVGGGLLGLLVVAYISLAFAVGDRIPAGTSVAGVDIGGLGPSEAANTLDRQLSDQMKKPMRVRAAGDTYRLKPQQVGLALDAEATARQAYVERTFNPIELFDALSGVEQEPVVTAKKKALTAELEKIAKKVDRKPREGEIRFDEGKAFPVQPRDGAKLKTAAARAEVRDSFLVADGPVALPTKSVPTVLDKADVEKALGEFAKPAMSGPVTLAFVEPEGYEQGSEGQGGEDQSGGLQDEVSAQTDSERTVQASPEEFGQALSMQERGGELRPVLEPGTLLKALDEKLEGVLTRPEDARIEIVNDTPEVVPSQPGLEPVKKDLRSTFVQALRKQGDSRVAEVATRTQKAELTTTKLEGLGVKEVVGEFSTDFPYANYRNVNIGRAAEKMNGTLVLPGETFSMNDTVGERTEENGFTGGYVIKNGNLTIEMGGGVSQVATTMYNAAFFAGMKDVEHQPHGFYISRYPVGREATVYWGSIDLRWKNTTPHAVYVEAWRDEASPGGTGSVTFRLWSTKYYEVEQKISDRYDKVPYETIKDDSKEGCVDQPTGVKGFTVDVERWLYRNGEQVDYTKDVVTYNPENVVKCKHPETAQ